MFISLYMIDNVLKNNNHKIYETTYYLLQYRFLICEHIKQSSTKLKRIYLCNKI